ncbi:site-specific integrase, partial [Enterobacter hormaechei subsp. steigerwaltii]|nr:site-specific integrase [Enterobacter hormaechei subsp. steigerwaltii]
RNSSRRGNKIPFRRRIDSSKPTCRQNRCCKNGSDHRFRFLRRPRIWEITDRTVCTWLSEAVETAAADGVTFSVPVTPHTFRHSYAMHMLYSGIPLKVLQSLMGHKSISSTEVYTKVFALDVAARHRVQFQMPGDEAVALLKKIGD